MLLAEETRLPLISVNIEESTSQAPLLSQVKNLMLDGRLDGLARLKLSSDSVETPLIRKISAAVRKSTFTSQHHTS